MTLKIKQITKIVNEEKLDILVGHTAIYGVLDLEKIGSTILANAFNYQFTHFPKCYLHGHLHYSNGIAILNNCIVSNAATIQHIIQIT